MNPQTTQTALPLPMLPPAAYEELRNYLHETRSPLSPAEALSHAIKLWIAQGRADAIPTRGYQWKQLFLPEGTFVRLHVEDEWYTAKVKGDDLLYRGNAVSPHQMAQQAAGAGRNAWREIWIRFPGEKNWRNAAKLRATMVSQSKRLPLSPADAMVSAAKSMSAALGTALILVEHANHQSQHTLERRLPRYRRELDLMDDVH
jgi:hypothetical protein